MVDSLGSVLTSEAERLQYGSILNPYGAGAKTTILRDSLAQLVEHLTLNQKEGLRAKGIESLSRGE